MLMASVRTSARSRSLPRRGPRRPSHRRMSELERSRASPRESAKPSATPSERIGMRGEKRHLLDVAPPDVATAHEGEDEVRLRRIRTNDDCGAELRGGEVGEWKGYQHDIPARGSAARVGHALPSNGLARRVVIEIGFVLQPVEGATCDSKTGDVLRARIVGKPSAGPTMQPFLHELARCLRHRAPLEMRYRLERPIEGAIERRLPAGGEPPASRGGLPPFPSPPL